MLIWKVSRKQKWLPTPAIPPFGRTRDPFGVLDHNDEVLARKPLLSSLWILYILVQPCPMQALSLGLPKTYELIILNLMRIINEIATVTLEVQSKKLFRHQILRNQVFRIF